MVKIFGELQASMGGYNFVEDNFGKRSLQLRQLASTIKRKKLKIEEKTAC
jgi:hypothetical protein